MCVSVDTNISDSLSFWASLRLSGSQDHGLCGVKFKNLSNSRRNHHLSIGRSSRCLRTIPWGQVSPVMRKETASSCGLRIQSSRVTGSGL